MFEQVYIWQNTNLYSINVYNIKVYFVTIIKIVICVDIDNFSILAVNLYKFEFNQTLYTYTTPFYSNIDICRHILVIDTSIFFNMVDISILASSNIDWRE
jgi:hypothetical protein